MRSGVGESHLAQLAPWPGFAAAADGALEVLHSHVGLDLWMVLQKRGDDQVVVAVRGEWLPIPTGAVFPWAESFCRHMVAGTAPRIAPRCADIPVYAAASAAQRTRAEAYVGIPLLNGDGQLFGTVCGFAADALDDRLYSHRPLLETVARLLSTVLAKEHAAAERSQAAAEAYALIDRDPVTGLLNWRGWNQVLAIEQDRQQRYGGSASLLAIEILAIGASAGDPTAVDPMAGDPTAVDPTAAEERGRRTAALIMACCRPSDTVARVTDQLYAVLAPHCLAEQAVSLARRLEEHMGASGLSTRISYLTCPARTDLDAAWADGRLGTDWAEPPASVKGSGGPQDEPGLAGSATDRPGPRAGRDLIDDVAFRRSFLRLRESCLRALSSAGLDHGQLAGLTIGNVHIASAGVLLDLPRSGGKPGGRIILTDERAADPGPAAPVRAYTRALRDRLSANPQHPAAPAAARWPLFPLISPTGKLSPVSLSARHIGRLLYPAPIPENSPRGRDDPPIG